MSKIRPKVKKLGRLAVCLSLTLCIDVGRGLRKTIYRTHPRKRPGARIAKFLKSGEGALTRVGGA